MRVGHPTRSISSITQTYLLLHFPKSLKTSRRSCFLSHPLPPSYSYPTMAGESESFSTSVEDNTKHGFERAEMFQSSLAGTVDPYDRHVFLCYKSHESWPSRVENSDSDLLPKLLASALKARKNDMSVKTRLTICEGGDDSKLSDGDVLIFPEMTIYRGLKESDVDSFVKDVLVDGKPWVSGVQEELIGSYVFVCAHNNRDRRCGVCGPILIEKFKEEIGSKDLKNQIFVAACSHIGGHKYAGNVITFSPNPDGKIAGNWYGYVTPSDVLELLEKQIGKGEVIDRIWRGLMGAIVKEAEQVEEQKQANVIINGKKPEETIIEENTESVGSCCQGVKGFSCCRAENVEKKPVKEAEQVEEQKQANVIINGKKPEETIIEENTESVGSCCQGVKGFSCCRAENVEKKPVNCEIGGLSSWMEKFEQRQVLTTVAVVGALATVVVAYGFYRRAR